jgi:hypothetical protein
MPRKRTKDGEELFADTWQAGEAEEMRRQMIAAQEQFAQTAAAREAQREARSTFARVLRDVQAVIDAGDTPDAPTMTRKRDEAAISLKIRKHAFRRYGAITTRVNAGFWRDDDGNAIMGADAGTSDILMCIPFDIYGIRLGVYFAVEVKKPRGEVRDNQAAFLQRVIEAGGVGIVARGTADLDRAVAQTRDVLLARFGELINQNT